MHEKRLCGNCPIASVERIEGNGITEPKQRVVIKCPYNSEFPRNPLDICSHEIQKTKAGYQFDVGSVARLLDLCRMHNLIVTMEYRRPSDGYLITVWKDTKSLRFIIPSEKLECSYSPEALIEEAFGKIITALTDQ